MKKLMATALAAACAGVILAAGAPGSFVKRSVLPFTEYVAVTNTWSRGNPVQVASVSVAYAEPTTNTVFVIPVVSGVPIVRTVTDSFTNAPAVVILPTSLWLQPMDFLVVSNLVPTASTVVIDYTY